MPQEVSRAQAKTAKLLAIEKTRRKNMAAHMETVEKERKAFYRHAADTERHTLNQGRRWDSRTRTHTHTQTHTHTSTHTRTHTHTRRLRPLCRWEEREGGLREEVEAMRTRNLELAAAAENAQGLDLALRRRCALCRCRCRCHCHCHCHYH